MNIDELQKMIQDAENKYQENVMYFSPNHELEEILFAFYNQDEEYKLIEEPIHRWYYELGQIYKGESKMQEALVAYSKAKDYNPTDFEILDALVGVYYGLHDYDNMLAIMNQMYPYIYCKNDMSKYYCRLGAYFLETYHPEIAEPLYMYSNLYMKNQQADVDLAYLEKAVGRKMKNATPEAIRQFMIARKIVTGPKQETLGLQYQVGLRAMKEHREEYAKQLFVMLYQLTQDEEIARLVNEM